MLGWGGGYMVVVVVATNFNVSSRQGFKLWGLLPWLPSLADPCLTLAWASQNTPFCHEYRVNNSSHNQNSFWFCQSLAGKIFPCPLISCSVLTEAIVNTLDSFAEECQCRAGVLCWDRYSATTTNSRGPQHTAPPGTYYALLRRLRMLCSTSTLVEYVIPRSSFSSYS